MTGKLDTDDLTIRWAIKRDLVSVQRIDEEAFAWSWSRDEFVRVLRQRNTIGMVAEHNNVILGFVVYELHKSRLHILRIAVDRKFQRQGVGRALVNRLVNKLSQQRRSEIHFHVPEDLLPAHLFLRQLGFKGIQDGDEILFRYRTVQGEFSEVVV